MSLHRVCNCVWGWYIMHLTVAQSLCCCLVHVYVCVCVCVRPCMSNWTLGAAAHPSKKLAMSVRRHTKVLADGER